MALLLQKMIATLRSAAKALAPWLDIVPLEATIVERARGAFLVHWFGPRLPFDGLSIRSYIVNSDELARRYQLAKRSIPSSPDGPNLTEPALGFAGFLAGFMMSPLAAIAGIWGMMAAAGCSLTTVALALGWFAIPALLVLGGVFIPLPTLALFGVIFGGAPTGYALIAGILDQRDMRAFYNLAGALALLMNATASFVEQLLGQRSQVRNPLLRQILEVCDRVAPLLVTILAAIAVLVRRVGPVLQPVASMLVALGAFIDAASTAIDEVRTGFVAGLDGLSRAKLSVSGIIQRVTHLARDGVTHAKLALDDLTRVVEDDLGQIAPRLVAAFRAFGVAVGTFFTSLFAAHRVMRIVKTFGDEIDLFKAAWVATADPPAKPPDAVDRLISEVKEPLVSLPSPVFPELPFVPDEAERALYARALGVNAVPAMTIKAVQAAAAALGSKRDPASRLELTPEARAALEHALRRRSFLEPGDKLAWLKRGLNRAQLGQFRQALSAIVLRIMPPAMRTKYGPMLTDTLTALDVKLFALGKPVRALPVRAVPATEHLRPEVKLLRLRMPGMNADDVKRFRELLVLRLASRSYVVSSMALPTGAS